jgi:thiol-disulfide isomerase/thioredoxin
MFDPRRQTGSWLTLIVIAVLIATLALAAGCKKKPGEVAHAGDDHSGHNHAGHDHSEHEVAQAPAENLVKPAESVTPAVTPTEKPTDPPAEPRAPEPPKPSLRDVIARARSWGPAYKSWYGKAAPEFTVTDLAGKEHKLSDYRGKDVMLVFWATWCPPCRMEIPHLKELRKTVGADKLAILAITYEQPLLVKKFVGDNKIDYAVVLEKGTLPAPFGVKRIYQTSGIPCSFFVNPDGKIKLATSGLMRLSDMQAILGAE